MPSRNQRSKTKRPCTRHLLPWGYDAPVNGNISLDTFIDIITAEYDDASTQSGLKNVLIYWDRGDLDRGDEAKLREMDINSNLLFAHVIDSQEWFRDRYPKGRCGKEKHNLGEAAAIMGVEMTTQADLDAIIDIERRYKLGAMRHCAAGDSDLTVSVSAELRHLRIAELDAGDGRNRKINNKYCLWGLDFEGGGHIGQGTTEIGLAQFWASDLEELGRDCWFTVNTRHAIILETFDDHLCRKAQNGKIAIDDRHQDTYLRWNFRGGPNTTEKCGYIFQKTSTSTPQLFSLSIDSEIISSSNMAWWITHQIPTGHRHDTDEQVTNIEFLPLTLMADRYPTVVLVDSQNEDYAARLAQIQVGLPGPKEHQAERRRPRVEEEDWCM